LADEKRYGEAEKLFRETLEIKRRRLGDDHHSTLVTAGNLAETLTAEGKYAEAEQLLRQTLATEQRKLGAEHSDTLVSMADLAEVLVKENRLPEAERIYRELLQGRRQALGADHPYTADTAYDLACVLAREGKRDEAIANLQFAVDHGLRADGRAGLPSDPNLNSLHGDARFAAITAKAVPPATTR
jgi:tetratricopeptide (TPR) repeat protein